jgi:hypothetical protein
MPPSSGQSPLACPCCHLVNPAETLRCDCGFNFETGKVDNAGRENLLQRSRMSTALVLISFLLAIAVFGLGLFVPAYSGVSGGGSSVVQESGVPAQRGMSEHHSRATLAEVNGGKIYPLLAIPVFVAGLPLLFRLRAVRIFSAVLLFGFVLIGAASIGLFYIPSAIAMAWSAVTESA